MMNSYDLQKAKNGIMAHISANGPSLPATIASELRIPLLFISAFLSELYREQRLVMSRLKVGTSSLYLMPGQEQQLENFVQHLNQREREALNILKERKVVRDSELSPVHRVAIREIDDFAIPFQKDGETCWRYAFAPKENKQIEAQEKPAPEIAQQVKVIEQNLAAIETEIKSPAVDKPARKRASVPKAAEAKPFSLSLPSMPVQFEQQLTPFAEEVKAKLQDFGFAVQSMLKADKKDAVFRASAQGPHGAQSYLVIAKDKKKVKEEEMQEALQQAHAQRLLCLVLARGDMDKKTSAFVSGWSNFLVYKSF